MDDALLRVMTERAGRQQSFLRPPIPMAGGFWAAIYSFELNDPPADMSGPLVLRVMPMEGVISETIVQRVVAEQGYPTPRVVADGNDAGLGGAFMVMEHVEGAPLLAGLGIGRLLLQLPATLRRLAHQMSTAALQLHALDPRPVSDALVEAGIDVGSLGVEARFVEVREAARSTSSGFEGVLAWLEQRRPSMAPVVVCHGDIHPFNMLVAPDGSCNVLDWTNGNLCRREYDVGFTAALLMCAPLEASRIAQRPVGVVTASLSRRFVDSYRRFAPINLDVVEWFETLQYARCLAAVATSPLDHPIIGTKHPFRLAAPAMVRQVRMITDVTIDLPVLD
jgi:aminoglycoside phosphotransferase (APT) family kinase protein